DPNRNSSISIQDQQDLRKIFVEQQNPRLGGRVRPEISGRHLGGTVRPLWSSWSAWQTEHARFCSTRGSRQPDSTRDYQRRDLGSHGGLLRTVADAADLPPAAARTSALRRGPERSTGRGEAERPHDAGRVDRSLHRGKRKNGEQLYNDNGRGRRSAQRTVAPLAGERDV